MGLALAYLIELLYATDCNGQGFAWEIELEIRGYNRLPFFVFRDNP